MAFDALRDYVNLATGLTEVTTSTAKKRAKELLSDDALRPAVDAGRQAQASVQALADEILATSRANRELLTGMVRAESERVVRGLGLVSDDELDSLRARVDRMADRLAELEHEIGHASSAAAKRATTK